MVYHVGHVAELGTWAEFWFTCFIRFTWFIFKPMVCGCISSCLWFLLNILKVIGDRIEKATEASALLLRGRIGRSRRWQDEPKFTNSSWKPQNVWLFGSKSKKWVSASNLLAKTILLALKIRWEFNFSCSESATLCHSEYFVERCSKRILCRTPSVVLVSYVSEFVIPWIKYEMARLQPSRVHYVLAKIVL